MQNSLKQILYLAQIELKMSTKSLKSNKITVHLTPMLPSGIPEGPYLDLNFVSFSFELNPSFLFFLSGLASPILDLLQPRRCQSIRGLEIFIFCSLLLFLKNKTITTEKFFTFNEQRKKYIQAYISFIYFSSHYMFTKSTNTSVIYQIIDGLLISFSITYFYTT